jgi:hypothetical protein
MEDGRLSIGEVSLNGFATRWIGERMIGVFDRLDRDAALAAGRFCDMVIVIELADAGPCALTPGATRRRMGSPAVPTSFQRANSWRLALEYRASS